MSVKKRVSVSITIFYEIIIISKQQNNIIKHKIILKDTQILTFFILLSFLRFLLIFEIIFGLNFSLFQNLFWP